MRRRPPPRPRGADRAAVPTGEVYFELRKVGQAIKVAAIDADSGIEVVIMGPASASQAELQSLALKKLLVRLDKEVP